MAMSLPIPATAVSVPALPASNGTSPASAPDSPEPESPTSVTAPTLSLDGPFSNVPQSAPGNNQSLDQKRKSSRRANTAERRATHNAVERQRRETLNGRFLDLAGLLPNLSQIRRPSKSAIVNSSIAHVHASRRHRLMAARELRLIKVEADALRRELNEWRDRAGLPRCDEPPRSESFSLVMSGEIEVELPQGTRLSEDDEGGDFYDDEGDFQSMPNPAQMAPLPFAGPQRQQQVQQHQPAAPMGANPMMSMSVEEQLALEQMEMDRRAQAAAHALLAKQHHQPQLRVPHPSAPVQLDPAMFEQHALYPAGHPAHFAQHATQWGIPVQDAAAHGYPDSKAYLALQQARATAVAGMQHGRGRIFGSPVDGDDSASVGSLEGVAAGVHPIGRARSGSNASGASAGSGYTSPSSTFEMPGALAVGYPPHHGGGASMHNAFAMMM